VVYWRKLIKKDFILICDVCVICGKYLFMNSLNRLSSYKILNNISSQRDLDVYDILYSINILSLKGLSFCVTWVNNFYQFFNGFFFSNILQNSFFPFINIYFSVAGTNISIIRICHFAWSIYNTTHNCNF